MTKQSRKWYVWVLLAAVVSSAAASGTYLTDHWLKETSCESDPCPAGRCPVPQTIESPVRTRKPAPQLRLPSLHGGDELDLAKLRGVRPAVLVIGSLTCNMLQNRLPELEEAHRRYGDRAAFAFIAITEAGHRIEGFEFLLADIEDTIPGWKKRPFIADKVSPEPNQTRADRLIRACNVAKLTMPTFIDTPRHDALRAFSAFPARLVVINTEGQIERDFGSILGTRWNIDELDRILPRSPLNSKDGSPAMDDSASRAITHCP